MNFSAIKTLIELIFKIFKHCETHRITSLVKMGFMMITFYMAFTVYFVKNQHSEDTKRLNALTQSMGNIVKGCGKNSFVSWLTVENNISSKSIIRFNDVLGCGDNCPKSVKIENNAYFKEYFLSYDDMEMLKVTKSNEVIYCEKKNGQFECPKQTPLFLEQITKLTNLELSKISFVVVRDLFRKDIIYIFTLSFAKIAKPTCSTENGNNLLQNLSINAYNLQ